MLRILHHVCVETKCYEKSLEFYRDVLGFSVVRETSNFHGRKFNTWLRNADILIELQTPKKNGWVFHPFVFRKPSGIDHICFLVDDITGEVDRISRNGHASFKKKDGGIIYRVSGISLCKIIAPEGTVIELREQDICF